MALNMEGAINAVLTLDTAKFKAGLEEAKREGKAVGDYTASASDRIAGLGNAMASVGKTMTATMTTAAIAVGTAVVKTYASFEDAMLQVKAVSGATEEEYVMLAEAAKEAGATTRFSASESANALNYMAMAGWTVEQMLAGLPGVMDLAAASGSDLAETSDIVTDALTAMHYGAEDAGRLADVLAAASSNANTNVSMMGGTFKYAASVAGTLGYSMEDLAVAAGLMANAGIKGEMAGTQLRSGMLRMLDPSAEMTEVMEKYGLSIQNADGSMKSLNEVMLMYREKLGGLDAAEQGYAASVLFGTEASAGWLSIINASSADFDKLTGAVNGAKGAASSMAETMESGVAGGWRSLKSAVEGAMIEIGEKMAPSIQSAVEWVTELVRGFGSLDDGTQSVIMKIAGIAAVAGPAILIVGKLAAAIASMSSPIGLAITGLTALAAALIGIANANKRDPVQEAFDSMREGWRNREGYDASIAMAIDADVDITGAEDSAEAAHEKILSAMRGIGLSEDDIALIDEAAQESNEALMACLQGINLTPQQREAIASAYNYTSETLSEAATGLFDSVKGTLTDGEADTAEIVSGLIANADALYSTAQTELDAWYEKKKKELDTQRDSGGLSPEAYMQQLADLETQYQSYGSTLGSCEEETVAWIQSMAGKSAEYVAQHLDELDALQEKVDEVMLYLDEANARLTGGGWTAEEFLVTQGLTSDANVIKAAFNDLQLEKSAADDAALAEYQAGYQELYAAFESGLLGKSEFTKKTDALTDEYNKKRQDNDEAARERLAAMLQGVTEGYQETDQETYDLVQQYVALLNEQQVAAGMNGDQQTKWLQDHGKFESFVLGSSQGMITSAGDYIQKYYEEQLSGVLGDLQESGGPLAEMMSSIFDSEFVSGMVDTTDTSAFFSAWLGDIGQESEEIGTQMQEIGGYGAEGFSQGLLDGTEDAKSAGADMGSGAVEGAKNALKVASPSKEFYTIGQYVVDGMIQGIGSREGALMSRVSAMAARVAATARQALDIHSPSRVFREIGQYVGKGFALGIDDEEIAASDAMRGMVDGGSAKRAAQSVTSYGGPSYNISIEKANIRDQDEARELMIGATKYTRAMQAGVGA